MKIAIQFLFIIFLALAIAKNNLRQSPPGPDPDPEPAVDENTYANIQQLITQKFHLDWIIDFDKQIITGNQTITLKALQDNVQELDLDVQYLNINSVQDDQGNQLKFIINTELTSELGDQLAITLKQPINTGTIINIIINYSTTSQGTALSWLTPQQTSTQTLPYLFSQCEASHCRSVAPLQDTPQVKAPYSANVTIKDPIKVFISANLTSSFPHPQLGGYTTYTFDMPWPIPSYLLAIIAGNVVRQQVGLRTYVITEIDQISTVANELSDLELYLNTVEQYLIPYTWGIYQLVILPPSFPFGGMENPLLTFASPSIIVGDKSGTTVAIHEIVHSWTGNLVTCRNWRNMWMNEGFCVFVERKTLLKLKGSDFYNVEALNGNASMVSDMMRFGMTNNFSSLYPQVKGMNPDDSYSEVPYEKGFQFMAFIESILQPQAMQAMLKKWLRTYANQSVVWEDFQAFLNQYVQANFPDQYNQITSQINWEIWVKQPGLPPSTMDFSTPIINVAHQLAEAYIILNGIASPNGYNQLNSWYPNEKFIFIQYLIDNNNRLTPQIMAKIDKDYQFTQNKNKEILWRWFQACTFANYSTVNQNVETFLKSIGRMKMIRPIYQTLVATGQRDRALTYFNENLNFYHPIAIQAIKTDLGLSKSQQLPTTN